MLTWLTAWARLTVDDAAASQVANQAVARAASRRKRLKGSALKVAARHEAAILLAHGIAAPPSERTAPSPATSTPATSTPATTPANTPANTAARAYSPSTDSGTNPSGADAPDPRKQTTIGRLEMALETLAPYERLACVSYFLDGVSTDAIASLLGVPRERAIRILEGAAPTIALAVGDHTVPDFGAATDEVEVVNL